MRRHGYPRDKVEDHDALGRLPHSKSTGGGSSASRTSSGSRPQGHCLDAEHPPQVRIVGPDFRKRSLRSVLVLVKLDRFVCSLADEGVKVSPP